NRFAFVTGVRDPVALAISHAFENFSTVLPSFDPSDVSAAGTIAKVLVEWVATHNLMDTWFDAELRAVFQFDIARDSVEQLPGAWTAESDGLALLIIRVDTSDEGKAAALSRFLGREIGLTSANIAAAKPYYPLYRAV